MFLDGTLLSMFSLSRCVRCTRFFVLHALEDMLLAYVCAAFVRLLAVHPHRSCYLSGKSCEFVACLFFIRFILPLCNSLGYLATCPSQYSVLTLWRVRFGPSRGGGECCRVLFALEAIIWNQLWAFDLSGFWIGFLEHIGSMQRLYLRARLRDPLATRVRLHLSL